SIRLITGKVAVVGDHGHPSIAIHRQPGTAGHQVASTQNFRMIAPERRRSTLPLVKLVPVRSYNQRVIRMFVERQDNKTHLFVKRVDAVQGSFGALLEKLQLGG